MVDGLESRGPASRMVAGARARITRLTALLPRSQRGHSRHSQEHEGLERDGPTEEPAAAPPTTVECRHEGPKSQRHGEGILRVPVVDEEVPQRHQFNDGENCPSAPEHIEATGNGVNGK